MTVLSTVNCNELLTRYLTFTYFFGKCVVRNVSAKMSTGHNLYPVDTSRYYTNHFEDYSPTSSVSIIKSQTNTIDDHFQAKLISSIKKLLQRLEEKHKQWNNDDYSVYTGKAGIAYMFHHYGKVFDESEYTNKASELLHQCVHHFNSKRHVTFLTGIAGPLALGAVLFHERGNEKECKHLITRLKSLSKIVLDEESDLPDELLYGRAGYLYSLLYVNANISPPPIDDDLISQVVNYIITSGKKYSATTRCTSPLMYSWHNKEYLGGAHGLAGILYVLLQSRKYLTDKQLDKDIKPAIFYLQKQRFPSGNFLSSVGSQSDKFIQWCHGAPGMVALFCLAYEVFKDEEFLDTALECGDIIWTRGLLKKGYSICHGVAGNAYAFLCLFQQTKNPKYLYRACKFAEWCMNYGMHQDRSPDRPYSLFEGLAGVLYFLSDLQQPDSAKFPGYTI